MPKLTTRLHPVGTFLVGLIVVSILVVQSRAPDAPGPMDAAEAPAETAEQSTEPTDTPAATDEPPLADGCFRSGSSRDEVRAVMGAPDRVDFGAWVYGQSYVTFGYGVVLDYRNEGGNLRLC